jgi:hypothetical protein
MFEILKFIFQDIYHFLGFLFLWFGTLFTLNDIIRDLRRKV